MSVLYTGKGDRGKSLIGNKRIDKTSPVIAILGELDELNSLLGLARTQIKAKAIREQLLTAQENIFTIQANVASLLFRGKRKAPIFKKEKITRMENVIKKVEEKISVQRSFIVPGSNPTSAWLDYVRTVSRRVERRVLKLKRHFDPSIIAYLNRLSSLFFALARLVAAQAKIKEKAPTYR